jgi:hypothetical protein
MFPPKHRYGGENAPWTVTSVVSLTSTGIVMDNEAVSATLTDAVAQWAVETAVETGDVETGEVATTDAEAIALAEEDAEALEMGIASVFDSLRAEAEADDPADFDGPVEPTFALLAELNRMWAQPQALSALS